MLVAGVDGYRKGWVAVALDPSGDVQVSTHASFSEVLSSQARVIAVDIPIDPPGLGVRQADAGARAFVGGSRASSVFPTPPRAALEARTFAEANEIARTITGKGISQQAFALGRKILEVHTLAEVDERVIEMHPEVSFRELAGEPVLESKHTAAVSPAGASCSPRPESCSRAPSRACRRPTCSTRRRAPGPRPATPRGKARARSRPTTRERLGAIWR